MVLAGLCLLSVLLMLIQQSRGLRPLVRPVLAPFWHALIIVPVSFRQRLDEMTGSGSPRRDDRTAELEHLIQAQQQMIRSQQGTIESLTGWRSNRLMRGFRCKLIEARVLAGEPISLRDRRLLDAGRDQGVAAGQVVITRRLLHDLDVALPPKLVVLGRNYVVGRITECAGFSATLQLVTDRGFEMPAALWRSVGSGQRRTLYVKLPDGRRQQVVVAHDGRTPGRHTVGDPVAVRAQGNGREIVLGDVPAEHDVQPGDILTASESTELIPFGLKIGEVTRTEPAKKDAHFVNVYVRPFADIRTLSEVYIVLPVSD